jgi:heme exporter protein D
MSAHLAYVVAAYGLSAVGLAGLAFWLFLDSGARRRDLTDLEQAGIRRRSESSGPGAR